MLKTIKDDTEIKQYIEMADESMKAMGFTEHSFAHVSRVSETARYILETMDCDAHTIELVQVAAYMHDIGNLINRYNHSLTGANMAFTLLNKMGVPAQDVAKITTAIGNHDEGTGVPVNKIAVALILADKTDVRRSRVRNQDFSTFDIHDRVNYAVRKSYIDITPEKDQIILRLEIDTKYASIMDYFEIFLNRMNMCRKAAESLHLRFRLDINGQQLL